MDLPQIVNDFARGLRHADATGPVAVNQRSKIEFQRGIGPHTEASAVSLVMDALTHLKPDAYQAHRQSVPYIHIPRQRCDLCLGTGPTWDWCIEIKLLRFLGDNGQPNDNILMHILSPYPQHRSALSDCNKLLASGLEGRKGILIYGFEDDDYPLEPAISAFERLASARCSVKPRCQAEFEGLLHPVHRAGKVYGWEISAETPTGM